MQTTKPVLPPAPAAREMYDAVKALIVTSSSESVSNLQERGFFEYHTGGGCMALAFFATDESHVLVTDGNTQIPDSFAEAIDGIYDSLGNPVNLYDPEGLTPAERELRKLWTENGIPQDRQDELIAQIAAKAAPGAQVGPFAVPCNS